MCNVAVKFTHYSQIKQFMSQSMQQLRVNVSPSYLQEKSSPSEGMYHFSYNIVITNMGEEVIQLVARRWFIADANQNVQEVYGEGVVGQKPTLNPGENFEYSSTVVISTPVGSMRGLYYLDDTAGKRSTFTIPAFTLAVPNMLH